MDPRTTVGFLGTGASLASDIALIAYIFLIVPAMLLGFFFARRKVFFYHQITMTTIVVVNWIIIIYLMLFSYKNGVLPHVPGELSNFNYLLPTGHMLAGLIAQIIATLLAAQMWIGPRWPLHLEPIKIWMRLTLTLWLLTAVGGVLTYVEWYGLPFRGHPSAITTPSSTLVGTEEATSQPLATEEATKTTP